jgi:hypothetical protein
MNGIVGKAGSAREWQKTNSNNKLPRYPIINNRLIFSIDCGRFCSLNLLFVPCGDMDAYLGVPNLFNAKIQ